MWLGASLGMKSNHVFDLKVTIFINHKVKLQILTPQFAVFFLSNLMSILCPESRVRSSWSDLPFGGGGTCLTVVICSHNQSCLVLRNPDYSFM